MSVPETEPLHLVENEDISDRFPRSPICWQPVARRLMIPAMTAKSAPKADQTDDDAFVAAVDEGLADIKAGRFVPYEKVRRWLLSWGSDNELTPPKAS